MTGVEALAPARCPPAPTTRLLPVTGTLQRCYGRTCPPGACGGGGPAAQRLAAHAGSDVVRFPSAAQRGFLRGGRPLEPDLRNTFESRFGHDFGSVRIHTDIPSAESALAAGARAYTLGSHIAFAPGQFAPGTSSGYRLLIHELTHVIQQGAHAIPDMVGVSAPGDPAEREAARMEVVVASASSSAARTRRAHPSSQRRRPSGEESFRPDLPARGVDAVQEAVPPTVARAGFWEGVTAVWGAGPLDAYRASVIADESLMAAQNTGLPGLLNGPADAWRHCFWNCRMTAVIGAEDAKDIADNHEIRGGGPAIERQMDYHNNDQGRRCAGDCDTCCQTKLDAGGLRVIAAGVLTPSSWTGRGGGRQRGSYNKY